MRALTLFAFVALAACTPISIDKYIEAMSKDPATLEMNAAYMGGSLQLKRSMPTTSPCDPK